LLVRALVVAVSAVTLTGNSQAEHFYPPEMCAAPPTSPSKDIQRVTMAVARRSQPPPTC